MIEKRSLILFPITEKMLKINCIPHTLVYPVYSSILQYTPVYSSLLQYTPVYSSVYPNLPEEGCQQSFLSLVRERALCALYLYRSLDSKDTSLHKSQLSGKRD